MNTNDTNQKPDTGAGLNLPPDHETLKVVPTCIERLRAEGRNLPPEYDTRKQLARRISCSTRTIDHLLLRGLPYIKLTGKLVRFPRREVDEWLAAQTVRR
jgi:excisionase family DNA binding protein